MMWYNRPGLRYFDIYHSLIFQYYNDDISNRHQTHMKRPPKTVYIKWQESNLNHTTHKSHHLVGQVPNTNHKDSLPRNKLKESARIPNLREPNTNGPNPNKPHKGKKSTSEK